MEITQLRRLEAQFASSNAVGVQPAVLLDVIKVGFYAIDKVHVVDAGL
jgi:hypothetical protein